jgi:hypothetical protein
MDLQSINHSIVRYSQRSIESTFGDRETSVETWIDDLPYSIPLQVAPVDHQYLSLDSRRLYCAKSFSPNETVNCIVYQLRDPPTDAMKDFGIDMLELIWIDDGFLHRLTLRATTIEGVMAIRCVTQDSSFPVLGQLQDPSIGRRTYDQFTWKIVPARPNCSPTNDDFHESFLLLKAFLFAL